MNKQNKVILYGIGQHADVVHYHFENNLKRKVIAFTIDFFSDATSKNNLPIIQLKDLKKKFDKSDVDIFIAIGGIGLNLVRQYYFEKIRKMGYNIINCISNWNNIPINVELGDNCFIDDYSRYSPFIKIGDNYSALFTDVGHHSIIKDNVTTVGCSIGANVTVNDNCFVGISASIYPGITIGEYSLIDIGSIVKKDVPPYSVITAQNAIHKNIDARRVNLLGISYQAFQDELKRKLSDESGV